MTHVQKRGLCWGMAALMTAAVMVFVLTSAEITYATNDDAGILRAVLGNETGEPAQFHLFVHGLLLWSLGGLTRLFPALPWFSYAQIAMLALSCVVIAKSIMQAFLKYRQPLWTGAVLAAVFVLVLCMKHISRITFTLTSALLGAAAVAQMLSIEHDRGAFRVVWGMAGALALVCLSYILRLSALMPVIGFCGLTFIFLVWEHYGLGRKAKRPLKPMAASLAMVVLVLGALLGIRQYEITRPEVQEYLAWQDSRTQLMDYVDIANVPQEAYALVGWDDATADMARNWCFLDSDITTESAAALAEYTASLDTRTLPDRWEQGCKLILNTVRTDALDCFCLLTAVLVMLAALLGACFCPGRRLRLLCMIAAVAVSSAAMILILAMAGRLPMRAAQMILLPAAAALFALLPACIPARAKQLPVLCAALCAVHAVLCLYALVPALLPDKQQSLTEGSAMSDLEEYALYEPESLFLYDDTLVGSDLRVFPDYSEGVPDNVAFWGGWTLRSPESKEQFARYGIDLDNVDPRAFLQDHVYIASGRIDPPPMVMLNWLRAKSGPNIDYELYSEFGYVYIFHFYEY